MIRVAAGAMVALVLSAASCESEARPDRVMVPSSFASVTDDIDRALEAEGRTPPDWIVAGSQRLVAQLADGADAQVLITADRETMDRAVAEGLVDVGLGELPAAADPGEDGVESVGEGLEHDRARLAAGLPDLEAGSGHPGAGLPSAPCG